MLPKLTCFVLIVLLLILAACQPVPPAAAPTTQLTFTYWGSDTERAAVEGMVAAFEMKLWLDNPAHPVEVQPAFTDYVINYSRPLPSYYLRNYAAVLDAAIRPAVERLWANRATAAQALREAVQTAAPLMHGRWDR